MARTGGLTRRELKERDEITTTLEKALAIAYERRKEIIAVVVAIVVIAGSVVGYRVFAASRKASSQNMLAAAIKVFNDKVAIAADKERNEKAIAEFQKVAGAYPALPAGQIARYYIALSREALGDKAAAVQDLELLSGSADPAIRGIAAYALAGIHKSHGENQKAIDIYKRLLDEGGYSKAALLFDLAKLYQGIGQMDAAREAYQRVVDEFQDSPFRESADQGLKDLGSGAAK